MANKGAVIARIISQYDDKGAKAASKDLQKAGKSFSEFGAKVGKAFAVAAAASAAFAVKLGVDSVKAAMADQQSAAILANTLKNVAGASNAALAANEDWIAGIQASVGVVDDQLRPALGLLAADTHNIAQAQNLLSLALDVSAGAGTDLQATAKALAKAHNGNFASLQKLIPSLDKGIVKTKDFQGAVKALTDAYGGSALAKANTFQGQMDRIKIAFDEAKESIGYGLLPFVTKLADDITKKVLPALSKWLEANGQKLVGGFKAALGYGVAFVKMMFDMFSFVARNIQVFAVLGAVIVAAIAGAKVAAAASAIIKVITVLVKVYRGLATAAGAAAAMEALATGGASAAAGAAAFAATLGTVLVLMNKVNKDADKNANGLGKIKFNFNGLKFSADQYTKGLKGLETQNNSTSKSTDNLTEAQKKALEALKALGVVPVQETDPNELEAARINLLKQKELGLQAVDAKILASLESQLKANDAAQKYIDILGVLNDKKLTTAEIDALAIRWGMPSAMVLAYIKNVTGLQDLKPNVELEPGTIAANAWESAIKKLQEYLKLIASAPSSYMGLPVNAGGGIGTTTISPTNSSIPAVQKAFDEVLTGLTAMGADADTAAAMALSSARYTAMAQQYLGQTGGAGGVLGTNSSSLGSGTNDSAASAGNTTIIVQGNVATQADSLAQLRNDLLNSQLSGKQIVALGTAL